MTTEEERERIVVEGYRQKRRVCLTGELIVLSNGSTLQDYIHDPQQLLHGTRICGRCQMIEKIKREVEDRCDRCGRIKYTECGAPTYCGIERSKTTIARTYMNDDKEGQHE